MIGRARVRCVGVMIAALAAAVVQAQTIDTAPRRIAQFGEWSVVRKTVHFALAEPGEPGAHVVCSAGRAAPDGMLEFEVRKPMT